MKKELYKLLIVLLSLILIFPSSAFAREGICGYEGGISSGEEAGRTELEYHEVIFITGEPVVFKGTLSIKKNQRKDKINTTYTYNLRNTEHDGTLTRVLVFETYAQTKENGQITETSSLTSARENIDLDGTTYTIANRSGYEFTRSSLIDPQPAVQYHSGSMRSRKVYQVGAASEGNTVTVECDGKISGYDQYWGNAESLKLNYVISGEKVGGNNADRWGGTATVSISSRSIEELQYQKNLPDQISFEGSYVQSRKNNNVLEYKCFLPEFDAKGVSTDRMLEYKDSLKIETFPTQERLPTANPANIRGHWAEKEIMIMFGLEVFKGNGSNFFPDNYMSRAEFATGLVQIAKEIPSDPALKVRAATTTRRTSRKELIVSPFDDVSIENVYFEQIKSAYDRNLLNGKGYNIFAPNDSITRADATLAFVRTIGLENMAPTPTAVADFRDNDIIPAHARNAAYVAQKIGLIRGDNRGNMNPTKRLTKAEAAVMFSNLIKYLQYDISKEYSERLINY